jgi:hypothetical protein
VTEMEAPGVLGEAWLQRFADNEGADENALLTAMAFLDEAMRSGGGPAGDRVGWLLQLGLCHAEVGLRRDSAESFDQAVGCYDAALAVLEPDDERHDFAVLERSCAAWDRYRLARYGPGADPEAFATAADRLLIDICAWPTSGLDDEATCVAESMVGAARIERSEITGKLADLDVGLVTLAQFLSGVPREHDDEPLLRAILAEGYRRHAEMAGDAASADRAIEVGRAAIDAGGPVHGMVYVTLAAAYEARWERHGAPEDLDGMIECWRAQYADDPDGETAMIIASLLGERFGGGGDAADLAGAIELAAFATENPGDHEPWMIWGMLGERCRLRAWETGDHSGLDTAIACYGRALDVGLPDDETAGDVHAGRLQATCGAASPANAGDRSYAAARLTEVRAEAMAAYDAARAPHPFLAGILAWAYTFEYADDLEAVHHSPVASLAAVARQWLPATKDWLAALDVNVGVLRYAIGASVAGGRVDEAVPDLARLTTDTDLDASVRDQIRPLLPMLMSVRSLHGGCVRDSDAAIKIIDGMAADAPLSQDMVEIRAFAVACGYLQRGEHDAFAALVRESEDLFTPMSPEWAAIARSFASLIDGRPAEPVETVLPPVGASDAEIMRCVAETNYRYFASTAQGDVAGLREYADFLERLADRARPGRVARLVSASQAGACWLEVARRHDPDRSAARRAVRWYEEIVPATGGPHDPFGWLYARNLGEALRLAGDPDLARTRALARSAMANHAWQVRLQSGTDNAISAARAAAESGARVARWCLADGAHDDLLAVLDAGRGLGLRAAWASRGIAEQLDAAGHPDLAAEWLATAGLGRDRLTGGALGVLVGLEVPDNLRERVLHALPDDTRSDARLDDVRSALAATGADALVYLLPASDADPGVAVVVPATGPVEVLHLPGLDAGAPVIDRWAAAAPGARDATPEAADALPVDHRLDELFRWAWTACGASLVEHTRSWRLGRPARLVVVAMGALGLVPWHAAYEPSGTRRRYALDDIVFSYAVSARDFCRTATAPARPIRSSLVIGDPTGGLAFAGIEARAIHRSFYRDGTYLAADATPDAVLDWIATVPGPSRLHFACHAASNPRAPAEAHLVLAGGRTLTARRLLDTSRLAALDIDQAFLAACSTHGIGGHYDETFSLATAFLAAGARTVIGSLWPVPDEDTSTLMYLVHHYLHVGLPAADALHCAQRWMLDPQRTAPDGLPAHHGGSDPARPLAWAGFTHLGR